VIVLQAHQDMVCEARSGVVHDFSTGIAVETDGDWLTSRDTTLGADDGMGIALITGVCGAIIDSAPVSSSAGHPPLELLFTANEEAGMSGARGLTPGFLRGRLLLNLDSEREGFFTVGCAGLRFAEISLEARSISPPGRNAVAAFTVEIRGLAGGHSGTDIHRGRANAVILAARLLLFLAKRCDLHLVDIKAGSAPNMIARDAVLTVSIPVSDADTLSAAVVAADGRFRDEFALTDPQITLTCGPAAATSAAVFTAEATSRLSELLLALPHGVLRVFDPPDRGIVHTSVNLAGCETSGAGPSARTVRIFQSFRGAASEDMDQAGKRIEAVAKLAGARASFSGDHLPWIAKTGSAVHERAVRAYRKALRTLPREEFAHGMLECGVIADRIPDMDMVSTGPTIEGPHAPGERVSVSSTKRVAEFLAAFISAGGR